MLISGPPKISLKSKETNKQIRNTEFPVDCFSKAKNKVPFFKNSLGLIESYVEKKVISGDHTIIICRITNFEIFNPKKPLIYYKSKYQSI